MRPGIVLVLWTLVYCCEIRCDTGHNSDTVLNSDTVQNSDTVHNSDNLHNNSDTLHNVDTGHKVVQEYCPSILTYPTHPIQGRMR